MGLQKYLQRPGAGMADDPKHQSSEEELEQSAAPEEASAADDGAAEAGEDAAGSVQPEEALEAAQAEIEALKDRALRAAAEADNARRRATKDVENARKFALEGFVNDLLPVLDSLDAAVTTGEGADAAISEGIELSRKLFLDTLVRHGVERIDPVGEPFDPQKHQAMSMVESADAEPNSVLAVMQAGYLLNGRVVRAAMVMVSKAPAGDAAG